MTDNNTRCYPRTLAQAFKDADYASPVTIYRRQSRAPMWVALVIFVVLLGSAVV